MSRDGCSARASRTRATGCSRAVGVGALLVVLDTLVENRNKLVGKLLSDGLGLRSNLAGNGINESARVGADCLELLANKVTLIEFLNIWEPGLECVDKILTSSDQVGDLGGNGNSILQGQLARGIDFRLCVDEILDESVGRFD